MKTGNEIVYYRAIMALALLVALLSGYTAIHLHQKKPAGVLTGDAAFSPHHPFPSTSGRPLAELAAPEAAERPPRGQGEGPSPDAGSVPSLDLEKAKATKDLTQLLPRNILFTHVDYRAKEVALAGDFNRWQPRPMSKEKMGVWRLGLPVLPGVYRYNFVVNGRLVLDRNNRKKEKSSSLLIVEPQK